MEPNHPLKSYRLQQKPPMSQEQLAELLGVSKASVSRWETGEREPDVTLVPIISQVTGIVAEKLRPDLANLFRRRGRAA